MIEAQGYERRLANRLVEKVNHLAGSHTAHRCGWFDFHLGHLCAVDGVPPLFQSRFRQRCIHLEKIIR